MPQEINRHMQRAMASESAFAARNRLYAAKAKKEGRLPLAKLMTAMATGEQISARRALIHLRGKIVQAAAHLEELRQQKETAADQIYPASRQTAGSAGDRSAEAAFLQFEKVSRNHAALLGNPGVDTDDHDFFVCQVCGYIALDAIPENCPVCGAVPERFKAAVV